LRATADKLVPTALDILRSALVRGVTGRLSRKGSRGPTREIYVMQGQILAAHGPDDGPWIVRRLVNSGALTERQGKAFIRRLTRGIPFEELILGHVPDGLLAELLAGRFRQNLLDFLASPPPIDFEPMDTLFVPNIQSGHDTRVVLTRVVALRDRIGPLLRHRGPLTLRLGPSMPASRDEARLVDLCDPPISMRDLLTYSPFETGETLDHVMNMLSNGALVSDEGIRLQRTRGHGPTADYAVEELFSLDGPAEPKPTGVPAAPIVPEHLALLREETEAPVLGDFGRAPPAFRGDEDVASEAELPRLNTSHLVLVPDEDSVEPVATAAEPSVPVLVESAPAFNDGQADLTKPSTGLFEDDSQSTGLDDDGSLLGDGGLFQDSGVLRFETRSPVEPPAPAEPLVELAAPAEADLVAPPPAEGTADEDSVPESWRDLSVLGFGAPSATLDPDTPPAPVVVEEDSFEAVPEVVEPVEAYFDPDSVAPPEPEALATPAEALPPLSADLGSNDIDTELYEAPSAPMRAVPLPLEPDVDSESTEVFVRATHESTDDTDSELEGDDALLFGGDSLQAMFTDDEADPHSVPEPGALAIDEPAPVAAPSADDNDGTALVDAARRYLEEANERRKARRTPPPEPEPIAQSTGPKKFTGFDFHVDDSEMAMFADHDRYRGGGGGQFTLGKELLDKVELMPSARPQRVRMPEPELLPEEDSIIEMGEATAEEEAEAGVVALAFSAPTLDADQVLYKISVASEVGMALTRQLDLTVGPGVGQTTVQLLTDAAAGSFARLFHNVRAERDGSLDEEQIFTNLQQRPRAERRSLLDRGLKDFIERALSTAAEELPDEALEAMLSEVAGYQQRLRQ